LIPVTIHFILWAVDDKDIYKRINRRSDHFARYRLSMNLAREFESKSAKQRQACIQSVIELRQTFLGIQK